MVGTAVASKKAKNLLFHTKVEIQRLLRFLKISTVHIQLCNGVQGGSKLELGLEGTC